MWREKQRLRQEKEERRQEKEERRIAERNARKDRLRRAGVHIEQSLQEIMSTTELMEELGAEKHPDVGGLYLGEADFKEMFRMTNPDDPDGPPIFITEELFKDLLILMERTPLVDHPGLLRSKEVFSNLRRAKQRVRRRDPRFSRLDIDTDYVLSRMIPEGSVEVARRMMLDLRLMGPTDKTAFSYTVDLAAPGVRAGQQIVVQAPNGQLVAVKLPLDTVTGETFSVDMPDSGAPAPLQADLHRRRLLLHGRETSQQPSATT